MKVAASIALFFAMTTVAAAKPAPVEFLRSKSATAAIRSNADFNIGAAGATLERDYFRAQEPDSRSGPSPLPIRAEHFCQGSARSVLPISQTFRSGIAGDQELCNDEIVVAADFAISPPVAADAAAV